MVAPLYTTASGLLFHAGKILVLTVGLPARGKTHISRALERYLRWTGVKTHVVSLGDYRRKTLGGAQKLPPDYFTLGEKSSDTEVMRRKVGEGCEKLIWEFFESGGQVVIYDANNGRSDARARLAEKFDKKGIHIIFLESSCDNKEIIERNIRSVKISSPDYKRWDPDKAVEDYYGRIRDHEKYYEPVEELTWPSIRIINVGEKILLNKIQGYLQSRIVFFLMNIHNRFRTIWFARSGQSLIEHSYKADSDLSPAGWEYAEKLKDVVHSRRMKVLQERGIDPAKRKLVIWTSTRRRAHHTAWPFLSNPLSDDSDADGPEIIQEEDFLDNTDTDVLASSTIPGLKPNPNKTLKLPILGTVARDAPVNTPRIRPMSDTVADGLSLGPSATASSSTTSKPARVILPEQTKVVEKTQMLEINPGIWDGLTPDQAKKYYPEDWDRFTKDPYSYRVPRAESYHDLSVRLEPILIELERESEDLLIIGHASVIRCLLAYLIGLPASEIPAIEIARGDLLEIVPASYGVHSKAFHFWDGPGRKGDNGEGDGYQLGKDQNNFYENYAEDTKGKRISFAEGGMSMSFGNGLGFGSAAEMMNQH
ncbi:bifunctional 6-phosphofructo-2-kinase/fructose-2,6-bisphosphate 2-phosphatase [Macrolepiota fuliginosa MF-IS2]|uniref:Bifunctional 6-phosphofructo-2-kinase/fructose-2,6-bisphosphate 2-phosphatase n=1 Tax=Macrolepiota fuliginosa MF-IS2 TaxID=1400762 RepID=A0A9P5XHF3_9AGAR|nr:bifunctional 6-phosphofructo-2-kinase/fructose-2,6-bisphosphate 2-phosphatase [Macrolepiota fuliginosa MF-IS2]